MRVLDVAWLTFEVVACMHASLACIFCAVTLRTVIISLIFWVSSYILNRYRIRI